MSLILLAVAACVGAPATTGHQTVELLVRFAPGTPGDRRAEIVDLVEGEIVRPISLVPDLYLVRVPLPAERQRRLLEACADVLYAEPNSLLYPTG